MKSKILILILSLTLMGCTSVEYITPTLPDFAPVKPTRPTLETVEEEVPYEATINTIRLMEYSRLMEGYADGWETFYNQLKEDLNV